MARLLTQVLGTMSGSVGDIVFRRRGGRSYVSAHPSGYTPRTDAATVARKKQLKTAVEIAKNINSIPLLKADRKSTRLNSSHLVISYADFCVKQKTAPPFSRECCTSSVRGSCSVWRRSPPKLVFPARPCYLECPAWCAPRSESFF